MGKKKLNQMLLFVLIIIWGGVIYQLSARFWKRQDDSIQYAPTFSDSYQLSLKRDTVVLEFPERDPFLGNMEGIRTKAQKGIRVRHQKKRIKKTTEIKKEFRWPEMLYLGFIKSNKKRGSLALIRANGTLFRVKKGDKFLNEITINSISDDEIILIANNKKRSLKRVN